MSLTTISEPSCATATRRPAIDIMVEKLARRLLRWSERRAHDAQLSTMQPSHQRMAMIIENQRATRAHGSQLGR